MRQRIRFQRLLRLSDGPFPALTICYARRYLSRYPQHARAWTTFGIALVEVARYQEAEESLRRSLQLCPESKRQYPMAQLGNLFRAAGDNAAAESWYRKAIEADPNEATWHIFLGALLAKRGRLHEAEKVHRTATQCERGAIDEAYLNLGLVLRALERFQEAADCFRDAIRLDPKYRPAKQALRDVERCIEWGNRVG
jgi:tetratricopeptide (TPR) repeat protein